MCICVCAQALILWLILLLLLADCYYYYYYYVTFVELVKETVFNSLSADMVVLKKAKILDVLYYYIMVFALNALPFIQTAYYFWHQMFLWVFKMYMHLYELSIVRYAFSITIIAPPISNTKYAFVCVCAPIYKLMWYVRICLFILLKSEYS